MEKDVQYERGTEWLVQRDEDGLIRVTWLPDWPMVGYTTLAGQADSPPLGGHTYTRGDPDLPDDYPTSDELADYVAWAKSRWGP